MRPPCHRHATAVRPPCHRHAVAHATRRVTAVPPPQVRSQLVTSGSWRELVAAKGHVKRGKKIGGQKLSNKGAVGLASFPPDARNRHEGTP